MDDLDVAIEQNLVNFLVNGQDLRDLVRAVELPLAAADGRETSAGRYVGLPAGVVLPPSMHLLGAPDLRFGGVIVGRGVADFGDGTSWSYDGLGPFVFRHKQYDAALRAAAARA